MRDQIITDRKRFGRVNNLLWIVKRALFSRSNKLSGRYFPLLAVTATFGVALGITSLIVVLSVMNGFNKEVSERLRGLGAHIVINSNQMNELPKLKKVENVLKDKINSLDVVVGGEVILRSFITKKPLSVGVEIRGVERLPSGKGLEFNFSEFDGSSDGVVAGREVLASLAVHEDFGDEVELIAPMAEVGPLGDFVPIRKVLPVVGSFKSGIYKYDSAIVFLPFKTAKSLLGAQARESLEIRLKDADLAISLVKELKKKFPNSDISSWEEMNKRLFIALRLERWAMGAILFLTILISSFSIMGATSMYVSARRKEAALYRVLGMSRERVRKLFLFQGILIGVVGAILGTMFGLIFSFILSRWPVTLPDVYYLDFLPVSVDLYTVVGLGFVGIVLAIVSAWFPVKSVLNEDLARALRYE